VLLGKIKESLPKKKAEDHNSVLENVEKILQYFEYLTVFSTENNPDGKTSGLDDSIINGIIKAQNKKCEDDKKADMDTLRVEQLQLAIKWNRIDVANKYIFNDEKVWQVTNEPEIDVFIFNKSISHVLHISTKDRYA
jgi:hypothetical protein